MEKKELFRTTVFGGYQRDDVMEYIRSLEEEKEAEIKLAERESVECRAALEQENLLRQKLSEQLEETLGKNEALRRENEASAGENSRLQQLVEETEKQLAALQEKLQESREEAETARQETEVARRETEAAQSEAETARQETEIARQEAETARQETEASCREAETARRETEAARQEAETARQKAEAFCQEAETARRETEAARRDAEAARAKTEAAQAETEAAQAETEAARAKTEAAQAELREQKKREEQLFSQIAGLKRELRLSRQARNQGQGSASEQQAGLDGAAFLRAGLEGMLRMVRPAGKTVRHSGTESAGTGRVREQTEKPARMEQTEKPVRMEQTEKPVRVEQTEKMEKPAAEAPKASASDGAGSAARALSESMDPVFGDTDSSASRQYRQHVSSVNQTIADAQERIARMLGELQRDVDGE